MFLLRKKLYLKVSVGIYAKILTINIPEEFS